jgi:hypothetical protein
VLKDQHWAREAEENISMDQGWAGFAIAHEIKIDYFSTFKVLKNDAYKVTMDDQGERSQRNDFHGSRLGGFCYRSRNQDRLHLDLQGAQERCLQGYHG